MVESPSSQYQFTTTTWTAVFLVTLTSFLCMCAAEAPASNKTIKLVNNCIFPVWPAIQGSADDAVPIPGELKAGKSYSWNADPFWSGYIWGRTDCRFNSQGLGSCDTGDCGGTVQCTNISVDVTATTKVEFEFLGGIAKPDTYSVTLESGYNLPVSVVPSSSVDDVSNPLPCDTMECIADVNTVCPKELIARKVGSVIATCNGSYDGYVPTPPSFGQAFEKACPRAFPIETSTICPPSTVSYIITFCPRPN